MADADANFFALLGGQDGWLNSEAFLDQVPLWLKGEYVQMPLRTDAVRERFPTQTVLKPTP
jgi:penicillin amidase